MRNQVPSTQQQQQQHCPRRARQQQHHQKVLAKPQEHTRGLKTLMIGAKPIVITLSNRFAPQHIVNVPNVDYVGMEPICG